MFSKINPCAFTQLRVPRPHSNFLPMLVTLLQSADYLMIFHCVIYPALSDNQILQSLLPPPPPPPPPSTLSPMGTILILLHMAVASWETLHHSSTWGCVDSRRSPPLGRWVQLVMLRSSESIHLQVGIIKLYIRCTHIHTVHFYYTFEHYYTHMHTNYSHESGPLLMY